jgi:hypothetical protein
MTPKEKAEELVNKMFDYTEATYQAAKQCALIAVDEIINTIEFSSQVDELSKTNYWQEVKQEIEKL